MQNNDVPVSTRAQQVLGFFRIKHQIFYGVCTSLQMLRSVEVLVYIEYKLEHFILGTGIWARCQHKHSHVDLLALALSQDLSIYYQYGTRTNIIFHCRIGLYRGWWQQRFFFGRNIG